MTTIRDVVVIAPYGFPFDDLFANLKRILSYGSEVPTRVWTPGLLTKALLPPNVVITSCEGDKHSVTRMFSSYWYLSTVFLDGYKNKV